MCSKTVIQALLNKYPSLVHKNLEEYCSYNLTKLVNRSDDSNLFLKSLKALILLLHTNENAPPPPKFGNNLKPMKLEVLFFIW